MYMSGLRGKNTDPAMGLDNLSPCIPAASDMDEAYPSGIIEFFSLLSGLYGTTVDTYRDDDWQFCPHPHPGHPRPNLLLYVPFLPAAGVIHKLPSSFTVFVCLRCSARLGSQRACHGASDWGPGTCCETTPSLKGDVSPDT